MRPPPRHGPQHAQGGGDGAAACLHRKFHDCFAVEVVRVRSEGMGRRVFDPLVDGKDRELTASSESTPAINLLKASQHLGVAIGATEAIHHCWAREFQPLLLDTRRGVEQEFRFLSESFGNGAIGDLMRAEPAGHGLIGDDHCARSGGLLQARNAVLLRQHPSTRGRGGPQ